ncbi:hypothetical protein EZV62_023880 [Acer yangbiense]|uniref:BTB domain-containing protein n=1 Tax=Acer yangbiense TaxID=1000413 RepID=A0A5C7H537_9ROSI|nr:hypothetical protein EZV62_023880 [Acer yangbiense]
MEDFHNPTAISVDVHDPAIATFTKQTVPDSEPDVQILTSGGRRIPAHASILGSVSPVLESIIDRPRKHRSSEKLIPILGVPCDAVSSFVGFLYSSRCTEEHMEKYGIHLLVLSHVYLVPQLKQRCTKALGERLTIENVVDVLQLARLCDAPDIYLKCMKLVSSRFKAVEYTEGWKFLQDNDPWLELQILQFMDEDESLSEAMECLEHICTEGCTSVGPHDMEPCKKRAPCSKFSTCQGLQLLFKHFAGCKKRVNGGCLRCKRMWQLLRLHSSICDHPDSCKVPLCSQLRLVGMCEFERSINNRQFKLRAQQEKEDARWRLLVRKVVSAKAISSLSLQNRKRKVESMNNHGMRSIRL